MKSLTKSYAILIPLCLASTALAQELPPIELPPLPSFDQNAPELPPLAEQPAATNDITLPTIEVVGGEEDSLPELPSFENVVVKEPVTLPEVSVEPDVGEGPEAPSVAEMPKLAGDDPFADPDFDALFDDDKKEPKEEVKATPSVPTLPPLPSQAGDGSGLLPPIPPIAAPGLPTPSAPTANGEAKSEPVVKVKKATKKPKRRFSYKVQRQPQEANTYQRAYNRDNRHLPVAAYESDIDHSVFLAAAHNDVNGLRALLNAGRRMDMQNPQGDTPLITAVRANALKTARLLVARGANVHIKNRYGQSAIDVARQQRNNAALTLLSPLVFAQR